MALSQAHESRQLPPVALSHADPFSDPHDAQYGIEPGEIGPSAPQQPVVQYQPDASMPGTAAELVARNAQRAKEKMQKERVKKDSEIIESNLNKILNKGINKNELIKLLMALLKN